MVLKADLDQHVFEVHTEKTCHGCEKFKSLSPEELANHAKDQCPARRLTCIYCPAQESVGAYEDHVKACGAKTKECVTCGELVQNWMMDQHRDSQICLNRLLDKNEHQQLSLQGIAL